MAGAAFVDPSAIILPDGTYVLVTYYNPEFDVGPKPKLERGIYAFHSRNGLIFNDEPALIYQGIGIDPSVIHISEDAYRVYFWREEDGIQVIRSLIFNMRLE